MGNYCVKLFETWKILYDDIITVQDQLVEYIPPFNFNEYNADYDRNNDGSNSYNVWIEFKDVDTEFTKSIANPEFYNKQIEHFDLWANEMGYKFNNIEILSNNNSITYNVEIMG